MDEYIEKQAARPDEFCVGVSCQECPFLKDPLYGGCRVDDFIMALPPADVRHVVLCGDCRWFNVTGYPDPAIDMPELRIGHCFILCRDVQACWFCGDGEHKEDADG